jgi:hypothetical protein
MYGIEWAQELVENFHHKHFSGAAVIRRLYGKDESYIVELAQDGGLRWRAYKAIVKHVEKFMGVYEKGYRESRDFGSNYYTFDKYLKRNLKKRLYPARIDLLDNEVLNDQSCFAQTRLDVGSAPADPRQLQFGF